MKRMRLLLVLTIYTLSMSICQLAGQSAKADYNLLWEVSGKELKGKSYVFGAIHMNDPRIFDLTDSLHYAIANTEGFAAEANFDSVGRLAEQLFEEEFFSNDSEEDSTDTDDMDLYDPDGYPTVVDGYLYQVAKKLGKEISGIEELDGDMLLEDDLPNNWRADFGDEAYEAFVELMEPGNKEALLAKYPDHFSDLSPEILARRDKQLAQMTHLMTSKPYFFAIGISHLVGDESLLVQLVEAGYTVRKVGYGRKTQGLSAIYASDMGKAKPPEIKGLLADYTFAGQGNTPFKTFMPGMEASLGIDVGHGLMSVVIAVDLRLTGQEDIDLADFANAFGGDGNPLELASVKSHLEGFQIYEDKDKNEMMQVGRSGNLAIVQLLKGFAASSLTTVAAQAMFASLTIPVDALTEDINVGLWRTYDDALDLGFRYSFPISMDFVANNAVHPDFLQRDSVLITFKNCTVNDTGDEYLVKSTILSSGIIFLDNNSTIDGSFEELANAFGTKVKKLLYTTHDGYPAGTCEMPYKSGKIYLKCIVRANQQIMLLQFARNGNKDTAFFDALEMVDDWQSFEKTYDFDMQPLTISLPVAAYITDPEIEEGEQSAYSFRDVENQVSIRLAEAKFSTYEDYIIDETLLSQTSKEMYELTDSMIEFKSFKLDGETVGYTSHYKSENTSFHTYELHMAYLDKGFSMLAFVPDGLATTDYVEQLWNTIKVEKGDAKKYISRKAPQLLTDLLSRDSTTFYTAAKNLPAYENFSPYDLPEIYKVVAQPLLDEEDGSTKYELILHMNNLGYEVFEWEQLYPLQTNESIRRIMLESLSQQYSNESLEVLFDYVWSYPEPDSLEGYMFGPFADSLEFYDNYYGELKQTVEKGINRSAILTVMQLWEEQGKGIIASRGDSTWFASQVQEEIDTYLASQDTTEEGTVSSLVMDYLHQYPAHKSRQQVVDKVIATDDQFGKYRLTHDLIMRKQEVPSQYFKDLADNDYYRYWILSALVDQDSYDQAPETYRSKEKYVTALMSYNMHDGYGVLCEESEIVKTVKVKLASGKINMYLTKCDTGDDNYYYGLIGPYFKGRSAFADDQSVFYNIPIEEADLEGILAEMIKYVESK